MKIPVIIIRDDPCSPARKEKEIQCFIRAIQSVVGRAAIEKLSGYLIPEHYVIQHNTAGNDPPDIEAFGLRFEHTEYPPDQSATQKVYEAYANTGMMVPPYSHGKGDVKKIAKIVRDQSVQPLFTNVSDNVNALEDAFRERIMGAGGKDISVNDVLLLDARQQPWTDWPTEAARRALAKAKPKYIKLILYIYWTRTELGRPSVPAALQLYP